MKQSGDINIFIVPNAKPEEEIYVKVSCNKGSHLIIRFFLVGQGWLDIRKHTV